MWFSMVYSFIDNDTRHHSGQNVVDSHTTLNHIRFVFYHNIKETKSLSWQLNTPTRIWLCTCCIMQMSCLYASDSFKNFCKLAEYAERNYSKKCLGKEWWRVLVIDKSTYHEKPHFDLFFYHNINVKENVFFSERKLKKALRDTLMRAPW